MVWTPTAPPCNNYVTHIPSGNSTVPCWTRPWKGRVFATSKSVFLFPWLCLFDSYVSLPEGIAHVKWIYPFTIVIFHSYVSLAKVSLPEGSLPEGTAISIYLYVYNYIYIYYKSFYFIYIQKILYIYNICKYIYIYT